MKKTFLLAPLALAALLQPVLAVGSAGQSVAPDAAGWLRPLAVVLWVLAGLGLGLALANGWRGCRRGLTRWLVLGGVPALLAPVVWGEAVALREPLHHLVRLIALLVVGVLAWVGARREPDHR